MAAEMTPDYAESSEIKSRTMQGAGSYTLATKGCFDVIANAKDIVGKALSDMTIGGGASSFCIADYGTADGGTSIDLIDDVIAKVRSATTADKEIVVLYEDIPTNPWTPLFEMMSGLLPLPGGRKSYLSNHPHGVYVHAVGTSFYKPVAPAGTVDLGVSFTAMHWTSSVPCNIPVVLHSVQADDTTKAAYASQSADDWALILKQRAHELRSGGRLVMANFCVDEKGCYLGHTSPRGGPSSNMHSNFARFWAELRDEGVITAAEYEATNFPQYYRSVEDFKAPLEDTSSPVYAAGLRLESIETRHTPCPFAQAWKAGKYSSAGEFAADYVPTLRSWSTSVFLSGLDASRKEEEKKAIVERFWGKYEAEVAANPDAHGMDYIHAFTVIRKE